YAQETRTTYPSLYVDQKTYKLGESSEFRVSVEKADNGVRVEYRSSFCVVKQTYTFITSKGTTMTDGVQINYDIENVSAKDASIGLRVLLDTWLGEKASSHFTANRAGALAVETAFAGDFTDAWLRSSAGDEPEKEASASFQVLLTAPATRPDSVLAANWKRLNDSPWSFEASSSRNFTLLPYSINDSAVAMYYEPVNVRPGASRSVVVIFGQANDDLYATDDSASASTDSQSPEAVLPSETAPLDEATDLVAVRSILEALNAAIESGIEPTREDLEQFESSLQRLEARKGKY
ncbi:MAG: hypothetical protein JXM71_11065, partial [Spirochaetales bacterium]|nr:hypothetical protein [Spirochaetales bacterium]